ncbi:MAG: winged helix-turn-helix transcriptional regulator [Chromatocurvus sp.]
MNTTLSTRANSINRALDEIGDKWCLLIIQEVFWGINTFSGMLAATGASRGVLSDRLKWLQQVGCLRKALPTEGKRGGSYHLTRKSIDLYDSAMMAIEWERRYYRKPSLDAVKLVHNRCGMAFSPRMQCRGCEQTVDGRDVSYRAGPGATIDEREKKVRRRSSISIDDVPSERSVYRNLINIVGDRWTANLISLAFHGHHRFEAFHRELPVATNILSDRLRLLEQEGVFGSRAYQQRPRRFEYYLTEKGWDLFPYFVTLLQWGDKWCDSQGDGPPILLHHDSCGRPLRGDVVCSQCGEVLKAYNVRMTLS